MVKEQDYKRKLLEAEVEIEKKDLQLEELNQCLSRLSLVANDLGTELDQQLNELRRQIKNKSPSVTITKCIERISQAMLALDSANGASGQLEFINNVCNELFEFKILSGNDKKRIDNLLKKSNDESYLISRFMEIFRNNLKTFANKNIVQEQSSLNVKVDARKSELNIATSLTNSSDMTNKNEAISSLLKTPVVLHCNDNFNQSLIAILDVITVPKELEAAKQTIFNQLESNILLEQVESIVENISKLIIKAYFDEKVKFKLFLDGLNARFLDINKHLKTSLHDNNNKIDNSLKLQKNVAKKIDIMQSNYHKATDFNQIIKLLDHGFSSIRTSMKAFHETEIATKQRAEVEISNLQSELKKTQIKALDLHASLKSVSEQSQKDSLTGLFNRESYELKLDHLITKVQMLDQPFVMAVADIDHFKTINDTYGHLSGDEVLRDIARLIQSNVRKNDFVARYGGEEFVIVLSNINLDKAEIIFNKMLQCIEKKEFVLKGKTVNITTSIGFTIVNQFDTKETAFARADEALYQAKNGGRNQVVKSL